LEPATQEVVTQLQRFFARRCTEVVAAWLFGSVARGTARADSDVDVAVLFTARQLSTLEGGVLDLEGELERDLGRVVDVVDVRRAPVDLVHRVLRDGIPLCDRDASKRIRFEVKARNDYFDLLPHLHRYRRHG